MQRVAILAGGNSGDVEARFEQAAQLLTERVGRIVARSANHRSAAWGFSCEAEFTNCVFVVESSLAALELLDTLQAMERELGRDREAEAAEKSATGERYASRAIDLDILLYGDERIRTERLTVPHALVKERDFALTPLGEALAMGRKELLDRITKIENSDEH